MQIISERVKYQMKKQNLNYRDITNNYDIALGTLTKICNGNYKTVSTDTILTLCKALNVSSDYLLGLKDEESNNYEMVEISKKIGISVKALEKLENEYNEYLDYLDFENPNKVEETVVHNKEKYSIYSGFPTAVLNQLIESDFFEQLMTAISDYFFVVLNNNDYYLFSEQQLRVADINKFGKDIFEENSFWHRNVLKPSMIDSIRINEVENVLKTIRSNDKYTLLHHRELYLKESKELEECLNQNKENDKAKNRLKFVKSQIDYLDNELKNKR